MPMVLEVVGWLCVREFLKMSGESRFMSFDNKFILHTLDVLDRNELAGKC